MRSETVFQRNTYYYRQMIIMNQKGPMTKKLDITDKRNEFSMVQLCMTNAHSTDVHKVEKKSEHIILTLIK